MADTASVVPAAPPPASPGPRAAVAAALPAALAATQAAAAACQPWFGRGDGHAADHAATEAMRAALAAAPGVGIVVIGEGEKDEAPMLANGERVGTGAGPAFDVAVDPLECTSFLAAGQPGALATIAVAESGCLWRPGPSHYLDKLVVGPAARDAVSIADPPERTLANVAEALECRVGDLRVVVLDKPRHRHLVARLRAAGAQVTTPAAGDVAGALAAVLPDGGADLLLGVGGTPEGVMAACAVREVGGGMQARLAPQREPEAQALARAGLPLDRILHVEDLVSGPAAFVATGVSGGPLLRRPWPTAAGLRAASIVVAEGAERRLEGLVPDLPAPDAAGR